jgi:tetratricopeptide (TPR) repeat protein
LRGLAVSAALFPMLLALGCKAPDVAPPVSGAERSAMLCLSADSAVQSGNPSLASETYLHAALLLEPGSARRIQLAELAASFSLRNMPAAGRIMLEGTSPLAPFNALRAGGAAVANDLIPGLEAGLYHLPDYIALMAAESLLATDPQLAVFFLGTITGELPGSAGAHQLLASYRAALGTGDMGLQEQFWNEALAKDDSELMAGFYHHRGMARGSGGVPDLLESFRLWPAGDMHARAYARIRDLVLADPALAEAVAEPFYGGGLWNELYDIAISSSAPSSKVLYLAGRTRDRLGFYDEANQLLGLCLERWPRGEDAPNAAIFLGRNLGALGQVEQGMEMLDFYGREWPSHFRISNLPWYRGSLLAENGLWERSIPHFYETLERYPSNTTADDAQFHICLALMKTGRDQEAMEAFGNFNARWTQSVYRPSSRYWYGSLLMESGDPSGRGVLERLVRDKPESLPAAFARDYLGIPQPVPSFTQEPLAAWMTRNGRPPADPPRSALDGLLLLQAGCRKWALDLFRQAEGEVGDVHRLAPFYLANGVWERGPTAAWRMWSLAGDDRPLELWRLRYPDAWSEDVVAAAERFEMDPRLLWAIMRQESAFQPSCYSTAGARGLIQMIPSTSEYVALEMGWSDSYSPDILYEPSVSILYGAACISSYGRAFDWELLETLAAYNGGPHNAERWGFGSESDKEFFSRITFNETKKYVEIVYHNYMVYKHIYPEYD